MERCKREMRLLAAGVTVIRGHDMYQSQGTTGTLDTERDVSWAEQHCCDIIF